MRTLLVAVTLLAFGCAELRYPTRTEMVEVAPSPVEVVPAREPVRADARKNRRLGLQIGGTILTVVGAALIIGGAVGVNRQQARNAAEDAECAAQGGWFCGLGDGLALMPYAAVIGLGGFSTIGGLVLFGLSTKDN
jgi:hypothetical protein